MNETSYMPKSRLLGRRLKEKDKPRKKSLRVWLIWSVTIVLWAILLYSSYSLAEQYVAALHDQLADVQASTAELHQTIGNLQSELEQHREQTFTLQEQFNKVERELEAVKEEVLLAEGSLEASDETKQTLSQRITELSKELNHLRASLKKLEETTRVF